MKKKLQELRKEKNLTQEQAARLLTITKEYLSMLENGDRNPSDSLKEKMSKLYNCSISDIFLAISSTKRLKNKNMPTN
jgi:putative transcriptional regulator